MKGNADNQLSEETISRVKVLDSGELLLALEGGGRPSYQHVYREAAGVYWDDQLQGFVSRGRSEWAYSLWFKHIVAVCRGVGVALRLSTKTQFIGVTDEEQAKIRDL